jgi:cysteine synthase B
VAGFAATNDALKLRPTRCEALASILDAIGNTPLVQVRRCLPELPGVELFAKLEWLNPGGSAQDRAAWSMVSAALDDGRLQSGQTIVDATNGSAALSYGMVAAATGHAVRLVMSADAPPVVARIARALGVGLVRSDAPGRSEGAVEGARSLAASAPGRYFYPDQYSNPDNPAVHARATAREIYDQTCGQLTHLVSGIGTGGKLMGLVRGLKAHAPGVRCLAVEAGGDGVPGLEQRPAGLASTLYDALLLDGTLAVSAAEARAWAERLSQMDGILAGPSSGAVLAAAVQAARGLVERGEAGMIVCLFPDRADRAYDPTPAPRRPPPPW